MDKTFNTVFEFNKRTIISDVRDFAFEACTDRIFRLNADPWIFAKLLHAERNTLCIRVDFNNLNFDRIADIHDLAWVIDALPAHVCDVEKTINSAKINKRTVIGDVLDDAFANIALIHITDDFSALLSTALFENSAARHNDVATRAVHFQNSKWLLLSHQWANIAHRANIHLRSRKEGVYTAKINGEAAFNASNDCAINRLLVIVLSLKLDPGFFAAGFIARKNCVAEGVFDSVEVNFYNRTWFRYISVEAKLADRNTSLSLQANIDDYSIVFNHDDRGRHNFAFDHGRGSRAAFKHRGEIIRRWI